MLLSLVSKCSFLSCKTFNFPACSHFYVVVKRSHYQNNVLEPWNSQKTEKRSEIERSVLVTVTSLLVVSSSIKLSEVIDSTVKLLSESTQM